MRTNDQVLMALSVVDAVMDSLDERGRVQTARAFVNKYGNEVSHDTAPHLNTQQWRVLRLLAGGASSTEIMMRMTIGQRTAATYIRELMTALDANNRAHLVAEAFRRGML